MIQRGVRLPAAVNPIGAISSLEHLLQLTQVAHLHVPGEPSFSVGAPCRVGMHVEDVKLHAAGTGAGRPFRPISLVEAEEPTREIERSQAVLRAVRRQTRRDHNVVPDGPT